MIAVGVRDLKSRLSAYLRAVRAGQPVLVTDRGHVIAELRPPGGPADGVTHPGVADLVRRGSARAGARNRADLYPALPPRAHDVTAAHLLDADRAER